MIESRLRSFGAWSGMIFFAALFPGMFYYHYFAAMRIVPLFLSGWWGGMTAIAALVFLPSLASARRRPEFLAFAVLSLIVCLYAGYHAAFGADWQRSQELLINSVALVLAWFALYGVGLTFRPGARFQTAMISVFLIMAGTTFLSMDYDQVSFIAVERFDAPDGVADYQWFALSFVMVAMYCLTTVRGWAQIGVAALSVGVLYVLSSRSELYGFVAVLGLWGARLVVRHRLLQLMVAPIAVVAVVGMILAGSSWLSQLPVQSQIDGSSVETESSAAAGAGNFRQKEVLNLGSSQSLAQRLEFLDQGLSDIASSPLFGVYGGQVRNGEFGTYIHNGLDMWRQFGFIAFVVFCGLAFHSAFVSIFHVLTVEDESRLWLMAGYISCFSLVLVVFTKGIFWPIPALAWGMVAGLRVSEVASDPLQAVPTAELRLVNRS